MGFEVRLQDEFGAQLDTVSDPKNILDRLFPEPGNSDYPMLGSLDPYADTVFNGLQMGWFLAELVKVSAKAQIPEEQELLLKVESMAKRVRDETHLYLKFVGD
jgi:hypothetical protein